MVNENEIAMKNTSIAMYKKTLNEMIDRNAPKERIDAVMSEIKAVKNEIKAIENGACGECNSYKEAKKSFFDDIKKSNINTIGLENAIPVRHRQLTKNSTSNDSEKENNLQYNMDSVEWIKNSDFIVHFSNLKIPDFRVAEICPFNKNKVLRVTVNDFVEEYGPLEAILKGEMLEPRDETITVTIVRNNGTPLYNKIYKGCKIIDYDSTNLDYSNADLRKFYIHFSFENEIIE